MTKYLKNLLKSAKIAKVYLIVFAAVYILGFVVGSFFTTSLARSALSGSVIDFYVKALSADGNVTSLIFSAIFSESFMITVFFLCSFYYLLVIVDLLFVFYRAYVLAGVLSVFIKLFGIGGAYLYFFCVFLRSVLSIAALSFFASSVAAYSRKKCKNVSAVRRDMLLISSAVIVAAIIVETLILLLLLRPINLLF